MGSQSVPYIYEDYASTEDYASGMMKLYSLDEKEKAKLSKKVYDYAHDEFGLQKTIDMWHETMLDTLEKFKNNKRWDITEL